MTITLSVFLFIYLVYLAIFFFFTFFNLYHMFKFGFTSVAAWAITTGYIIATGLALFVSYYYIAQIDWNQTVDIFSATGSIFKIIK